MTDVLDLADRLWRGEVDTSEHHPLRHLGEIAVVRDDTGFVASFANVSAFDTPDGLLLVDTGSSLLSGAARDTLRSWTDRSVHTVVYTHGHIDHCFGVERYEEENRERRLSAPHVVAHAAVPARFDRYKETAGYNGAINRRQFGIDSFEWPVDYRYPDETYRDRLDIEVGGEHFELHHARGETDDHTWVFVPGRRVLCTGDLFIWASPNCGNPQKVQRYPKEWAAALRTMAELDAETLLPGHGLPIVGADRVHQALTETAALLEHLFNETLAMMNAGATLDDIVHTVEAPSQLLERPYLRPVYDEPEFIVRNLWRLYGGWYDGNPSRLKPAADSAIAREVATLAGGATALADRARQVAEEGDLRLAAHLVEWASAAAPDDATIHEARANIYRCRRDSESSTMSKGVFGAAARESKDKAGA
ncbi:MAG: MBL fold metallo-hydrolase [Actinobacteria bacterium]|nr:MBL fold metallo-hydrolase [Actinomycetota bacterium]